MFIKKYLLLLVLVFAFSRMSAQLCQGSLGDPIVDITFGAGPNPGPALTTTKNLLYVPFDCPNDGQYTIINSTNQCFDNTWYTLNSDHTGDVNGYFMLINASFQQSEFFVDTVKGLCQGTTYEFAAWIMNIIVPSACYGTSIKPNLTFNIESTNGTVLKTYSTGDIAALPDPEWIQHGFFFTTPSNASTIVLRMINNSIGGCGNDLALDDITFRPCGPKLTSSLSGITGTVKDLCKGENADVTMSCTVSAGYSNPYFQWQESTDNGSTWTDIPGANALTFSQSFTSAASVNNYLYRLTTAEAGNISSFACRVTSDPLTIRVDGNPVATVSNNNPVCAGTPVILSASGGSQYAWSGVNSFSATGSPVTINNVGLNNAGKYFVTVTSAEGCSSTDSTVVIINPAPVAATAFTDKTICMGDSVLLSTSGGVSYLWVPAAGLSSAVVANPVAKPADTTKYTVVVNNTAGCKDSVSVTINVLGQPRADAGPDKTILEGQSVQLQGSTSGGSVSYNWSPAISIDNVHSLQPIVNPAGNTTYTLTIKSNNGCGISADSVTVHVYKTVIVPNAFSPNGDGINDTWNITALNTYDNYEVSVFNRYGQIVFTTKNYGRQWDGTFNGKPLPVGTYYYLIDLKQNIPKLKGYVVILR